ncbi:hypothetical protein F4780DRAFT_784036 [Xylariomycetidae sp. FL0641]|nr:hypothetical protein F4780DRAFT_784036 [Xylariomycetidae sp. FL0641]
MASSSELLALVTAPTAMPMWAPVVFGRGKFMRDEHGRIVVKDGQAQCSFGPADFLTRPLRLNDVDYWPVLGDASQVHHSPVFVAPIVRQHCLDRSIITEIAFTVYDTHERIHGTCLGKKPSYTARYLPPGDRGSSIWKFAKTFHYVVQEHADHDMATCANANHTTTAFYNAFSKTQYIRQTEVTSVVNEIYAIASTWALSRQSISEGARRQVVLVTEDAAPLHACLAGSAWIRSGRCLDRWSVSGHAVLQSRYGGLEASLDDKLAALGVPATSNGTRLSANAANESALVIHLLVALCFLSPEQTSSLRQGASLPMLRQAVGTAFTMLRVNHPPGAYPLTAAPSALVLPARPVASTYRSGRYRAAALSQGHAEYIRERKKTFFQGTLNWREQELLQYGTQTPTVRPETQ